MGFSSSRREKNKLLPDLVSILCWAHCALSSPQYCFAAGLPATLLCIGMWHWATWWISSRSDRQWVSLEPGAPVRQRVVRHTMTPEPLVVSLFGIVLGIGCVAGKGIQNTFKCVAVPLRFYNYNVLLHLCRLFLGQTWFWSLLSLPCIYLLSW